MRGDRSLKILPFQLPTFHSGSAVKERVGNGKHIPSILICLHDATGHRINFVLLQFEENENAPSWSVERRDMKVCSDKKTKLLLVS